MEKQKIWEIIYNAIVEVSPCAEEFLKNTMNFGEKICFVDLGINSIDYAEIAHIVMGKLDVNHSLDIFCCTNRISDAVDIFHKLTLKNNPTAIEDLLAATS